MASRRSVVVAGALLAVVSVLAVVCSYLGQGSPGALLARKGTLAEVETAATETRDGFAYNDVTVHGSSGLVVHARVRAPRENSRPLPGAVLVGGMKRGRRVVGVSGLDAIAR